MSANRVQLATTKHRLNKPPAMVASLESTKTKLARPLAKNALLASIRIKEVKQIVMTV